VIICQRYNAQDVACLAPPPPPEVKPPVDEPPVVVTPSTMPGMVEPQHAVDPEAAPLPQVQPQALTDSSTRGVAPQAAPASTGTLPGTGSNIDVILVLAAIAAAGGAVLLVASRRRRDTNEG